MHYYATAWYRHGDRRGISLVHQAATSAQGAAQDIIYKHLCTAGTAHGELTIVDWICEGLYTAGAADG